MSDRPRNVVVQVEIEMHVPDAKHEGPLRDGVDDATYERASNLVAEIWEAGDPTDATNAVIQVGGVEWLEGGER